MELAIAAAFAVLVLGWLATDREIYRGQATVMTNRMKHYSATHRTLFVVPHQPVKGEINSFIATVPLKEALQIDNQHMVTRTVSIRQRLFGEPRVTLLP